MKLWGRKRLYLLLLVLILNLSLFTSQAAFGESVNNLIYQENEVENITSGVTHTEITRYTDAGWLTINALEVDLSNQYIKVDTLTQDTSIQLPSTAKELAVLTGAIAAINASFFSSSSVPGLVNPIGPIISSGDLKNSELELNSAQDKMATFSIDKFNNALYDYWKADMTLYSPIGIPVNVARYNKPYYSYEDITVIDRKWSDTSVGIQPDGKLSDIVEMVVDGGIVTDIRLGLSAVEIPVNGYVVITRKSGSRLITDNFKEGDHIAFDIKTTPDWKDINMAASGGCIIVQDGKVPKTFAHPVPGKHPRTAVGTSKDGRTLYMVTVDGRQSQSIGMELEELAALMIELGAYNAINLDGGGSTTMVARNPVTDEIDVLNSPSDGVQRRIPTAIGLFSLAPPAPLEGLIIDASDINIFAGTTRDLEIRGYDRYYNPIEIKPEDVTWEVSGVEGEFYGNTFRPTTVGEGKIIAKVGSITAELSISALSSPVKLVINQKDLTLIEQDKRQFSVYGINKNGYSGIIYPEDVNWKVMGSIGHFYGDTFVADNSGNGIIDASVGDTHAYCGVKVLPTQYQPIDPFEYNNASFLSYPTDVAGSYEISSEVSHSGKSSGKLSYAFEMSEENRAVYAVFNNGGINLPENTIRVGFWVYNEQENSNWLRMEVTDSAGAKHRLGDLTKLDWIGWKFIEIPLEGIQLPGKLTRLYVVQVNPVTEVGSVYFDDVQLVTLDKKAVTTDTSIQSREYILGDSFEKSNGSFLPYPGIAEGSYTITSENEREGKASGRLNYSFVMMPQTQAAYAVFSGKGILVPSESKRMGLWINSIFATQTQLKAEIVDSAGNEQTLLLSDGINRTGWQYVEAGLDGISLPARVTRLYMVNSNPGNEIGTIYFDELHFIGTNPAAMNLANVPSDTEPVDAYYKTIEFTAGKNNYRFAVFGEDREPGSQAEKDLTNKLTDKINKYIDASVFVGGSAHNSANNVKKPVLDTNTGYKSFDIQDSRLIQLDMSNQGLRKSIQGQWQWLMSQMLSFKGNNVFIFLEEDPETFSDPMESELFQNLLTHYRQKKFKNVWVFYKGDKNDSYLYRGINYVSVAGFDAEGFSESNRKGAEYAMVSIIGSQVTYEFKPIE